jgi:uncharacterized protein
VIAVDTNILVYAHRRENPHYAVASRRIRDLASGSSAWGIPWPCVHEFLSIVTRPRVFDPPTPLNNAIAQVQIWMESPTNSSLAEADGYWTVLRRLVEAAQVVGPKIQDARIAAICMQHGVREFWSADRDFSRFPALKVVNPLLD